ncbi:hypothetical protein [Psychromonas antarctica]|uniref:hypothetical protein n=1 Tax=Psychromonas antarctica TaxID=67573 RepID=UPI001EE84A16|nr:hypothetical protein [Psychromonas antarctica]MCG6200887.1 hypothetical protein [Psychromonas antarctica]
MISSINSASSSMSISMPSKRTEQVLNDEQKTLISDTLADFDPENLTESDALSIVETFSEAGIQPGSGLGDAMEALGFDAQTLGDLVNNDSDASRPPPPPPPAQNEVEISSMVSYLADLMEERLASTDTSTLTDQDKQAIYSSVLEKFGLEEDDSIINTTA